MTAKQSGIIKNIRISQKYGVSRPTVGKWVENAAQGKNNLQLTEKNGRMYIMDNRHNAAEILRLKEHGVKYRNKIAYEAVTPSVEFYKIFNVDEIIDISSSLEFNHEVPIKYTYYNGGADMWNDFIVYNERNNPKYTEETTELLTANINYLLYLLKDYDKVNIIDLGPGNGLPALKILPAFMNANIKVSYTAVDISQRMIDITKDTLLKQIPDLEFNKLIIDFEEESLQNFLFRATLEEKTCNLIIYLGGNIGIYNNRIEHISSLQKSMGENDFLLVDNVLDVATRRTSFKSFDNKDFLHQFTWLIEEMGIKSDMVSQVFRYDQTTNFRIFELKLEKDVDVHFEIEGNEKIIKFKEGDSITVWRHSSWKSESFINEFVQAGLKPLQVSINKELDNGLIIGRRIRRADFE